MGTLSVVVYGKSKDGKNVEYYRNIKINIIHIGSNWRLKLGDYGARLSMISGGGMVYREITDVMINMGLNIAYRFNSIKIIMSIGGDSLMHKLNFKRLVTIALSIFAMLSLTGCGDQKIDAFLKTDIVNAMTSRVSANKAIVNKLFVSGLLSSDEQTTITKNIDTQMGAYIAGNVANNTELQNKLLASIVDWTAPDWKDYGPITNNGKNLVNSAGYTETDWYAQIVTTYIRDKGYDSKFNIPLFKGKDSLVQPISIIDDKTGERVNKRFGYTIYVIKPFGATDTTATTKDKIENKIADGSKSLDEMLEMVSKATSDKSKLDNSVLDQLFTKAFDENGKDVTLLDIAKRTNQVVANSIGSPLVTDSVYTYEKGELKQTTIGNKVINGVSSNNNHFNTPDNTAEPGNDMIIKDSTRKVPLMTVRFNEFNNQAVENIIKALGMSPDQYLFTTYNGENRVYIMEYPVHYVSEIKNKPGDLNSYTSTFAQSNMGINIRTGKLIKYGKAWGNDTDPGQYFEDSDPYLPVKGAPNAQSEGQSAFVIEGETPANYAMEIGETKAKVKTGRIILRDYLEATYAPKVVNNEPIVVFGRKLRVLKFSGSKNDIVAEYYDKEGKVLKDTAKLMVDDFADFERLGADVPSIKYIGRIGEAITAPTTPEVQGPPTPEVFGPPTPADDATKSIQASLAKIDKIPKSVGDSIKPTTQFPGPKLGEVDYSNSKKPLFYAMAVKKNMFDTALFSGWINNTDKTKNSLDWWTGWLADANRPTYNYTINKTTLTDYLVGNYTFELQKAGIIILDFKTISKIQKEYTDKAKSDNTTWFRTTFVVLGYTVICYAFILLLAWSVDTNVDLGFNILGKTSFGHWIAIKDADEMPYAELGETKYVTFQSLIFKTLGILIVGVLLILVNVVDIVVYLIQIFGGIAELISKLITGI